MALIEGGFPNYDIQPREGDLLITLSERNVGCPRCGYHLVWIRVTHDYDGKVNQYEAVITGKVHQIRTEVKCQACGTTISKPVAGHAEIKADATI